MVNITQKESKWWVAIDSHLEMLPEHYLTLCLVSRGLKRAGLISYDMNDSVKRSRAKRVVRASLRDLGLYFDTLTTDNTVRVRFAKDLLSLSEFVCAHQRDNHELMGKALGFPEAARTWYCRGGSYYEMRTYLHELECKGLSVPSWIAYCPFVVPPAEVLIEGECARVGRRYEDFAREFSPHLALVVRENFFGRT